MDYVRVAMNNARSRLLLSSFVSAKAEMSSKARTPSHYETLEVNQRATQGEIKSAYFKLSKQYHPDKNSSEEAIAKFRDVAEAYEVLGSYASRKNYDRSILTKTQYHGTHESDKPVDPRIKYYQSQAAVFRSSQKSGSTPIYDFDAWTQAHYGRTFERIKKDRAESAYRRQSRAERYDTLSTPTESAFVFLALVVATTMWILNIRRSPFSDPAQLITHRTTIVENESTDVKSQRTDA